MSAICGGIVKESEFLKEPIGYMMALVLPDEYFDKYIRLLKEGKRKDANKIIKEHAWSPI